MKGRTSTRRRCASSGSTRGRSTASSRQASRWSGRESGLKVVYSGDCTPCETTLKAADNADLLIHEATFAQDIAENAREYKHTTARDAAKLARQANVKQLVLTHFSTRYKPEELHKLLDDAKREFENTVI